MEKIIETVNEHFNKDTSIMEYGCKPFETYVKLCTKDHGCVKLSVKWTWKELLGSDADHPHFSPEFFEKVSEAMATVRKELQGLVSQFGAGICLPDSYNATDTPYIECEYVWLDPIYKNASPYYMISIVFRDGESRVDGIYDLDDFEIDCSLSGCDSLASFGIKLGLWDESARKLVNLFTDNEAAEMIDTMYSYYNGDKCFYDEMHAYANNCCKEELYYLGYDPALCDEPYVLYEPIHVEIMKKLAKVIDSGVREVGEDLTVWDIATEVLTSHHLENEDEMIACLDTES